MVLPAVDHNVEHLWLYYWQWQSYGGWCSSIVTIREYIPGIGWGGWNIIDPGTADVIPGNSPEWRRVGIDLTLFSGGTVMLGFHHYGMGTPGWFIDDLQIWRVPVVTKLPLTQGFENGFGDWHTDHGAWDLGTPLPPGPTDVPAGTACAGTAMNGRASTVVDSHLWTPAFYLPQDLKAGEKVLLEFDQWCDYGWSGMAGIDYSYYLVNRRNWFAPQTLVVNVAAAIAPRTWVHTEVDLSELWYVSVPLRMGFHHYSFAEGGWFVDNVRLRIHGRPDQPQPPQDLRARRQGPDLVLTWMAEGGTTSIVQASPACAGTYENLSAPLPVPGQGSTAMSYTDANAVSTAAARFYRILQLP